jgi:DNA polymerase alpha-associated DNA helicase A
MVNRMNQTMTRMQKMKEDEYSSFLRVVFGLTTPSPVGDLDEKLEWIDPSLNDNQKDAIKFALASREIALVHGPPGVSHLSVNFYPEHANQKYRPAKHIPS